jgi:asparaginyl-tRNA synthetase
MSLSENIKHLFDKIDKENDFPYTLIEVYGWIRTVRVSSNVLGFCIINDGSNVNGLQVVISSDFIDEEKINMFFKRTSIGTYIKCIGNIILSPSTGQKYEMQLTDYQIIGTCDEDYQLAKSKMNLDTLRKYIHIRGRTNTFGSVFRIRSSLTKILHDFYHIHGFLHLDPNIITTNECEGGA